MTEDEPSETKACGVRITADEVAALMNAALAARTPGNAIPPDLARKTFAVTCNLAAQARRRFDGANPLFGSGRIYHPYCCFTSPPA